MNLWLLALKLIATAVASALVATFCGTIAVFTPVWLELDKENPINIFIVLIVSILFIGPAAAIVSIFLGIPAHIILYKSGLKGHSYYMLAGCTLGFIFTAALNGSEWKNADLMTVLRWSLIGACAGIPGGLTFRFLALLSHGTR